MRLPGARYDKRLIDCIDAKVACVEFVLLNLNRQRAEPRADFVPENARQAADALLRIYDDRVGLTAVNDSEANRWAGDRVLRRQECQTHRDVNRPGFAGGSVS